MVNRLFTLYFVGPFSGRWLAGENTWEPTSEQNHNYNSVVSVTVCCIPSHHHWGCMPVTGASSDGGTYIYLLSMWQYFDVHSAKKSLLFSASCVLLLAGVWMQIQVLIVCSFLSGQCGGASLGVWSYCLKWFFGFTIIYHTPWDLWDVSRETFKSIIIASTFFVAPSQAATDIARRNEEPPVLGSR